jgi:hypothetical protein
MSNPTTTQNCRQQTLLRSPARQLPHTVGAPRVTARTQNPADRRAGRVAGNPFTLRLSSPHQHHDDRFITPGGPWLRSGQPPAMDGRRRVLGDGPGQRGSGSAVVQPSSQSAEALVG